MMPKRSQTQAAKASRIGKLRCLTPPENPRKPFQDHPDGKRAGWQARLIATGGPEACMHSWMGDWKMLFLNYLMRRRHQRLVRIRYFHG